MSILQGLAPKLKKDPSLGLEIILGQVWVGNTHEAICIPANSMKVINDKYGCTQMIGRFYGTGGYRL